MSEHLADDIVQGMKDMLFVVEPVVFEIRDLLKNLQVVGVDRQQAPVPEPVHNNHQNPVDQPIAIRDINGRNFEGYRVKAEVSVFNV